MRQLIGKFVLGTASVLALGLGGAALDYAADAGNTVAAASPPAVLQSSESRRGADDFRAASFRKDDIRWAQAELRYRGFYQGSLDGVLGPETRRALTQFQENSGLQQTASIDAQTWEALTGNRDIGQGSSMPADGDRAATTTNSSIASHLGR